MTTEPRVPSIPAHLVDDYEDYICEAITQDDLLTYYHDNPEAFYDDY